MLQWLASTIGGNRASPGWTFIALALDVILLVSTQLSGASMGRSVCSVL